MGSFLLFLIVLFFMVILMVFSFLRSVIGGVFRIFKPSHKKDDLLEQNEPGMKYSEQGAKRMKNFKQAAEDTSYEEVID